MVHPAAEWQEVTMGRMQVWVLSLEDRCGFCLEGTGGHWGDEVPAER